jgi:hypothetical protein
MADDAGPPEIAALTGDAAFMEQLNTGDQAALARWNGTFQALYPEEPAGPAPTPAAPSPQAWQPPAGGATAPDLGVPPTAGDYVLASAPGSDLSGGDPALEAGFRAFAHQSGFTVDEAWQLSLSFHEAAASAEGAWQHLDEATLAGKVEDVQARLLREPGGEALLAGARRLFNELRYRQPALAEHLIDVGAGTSLAFLKELGRVARRLGR